MALRWSKQEEQFLMENWSKGFKFLMDKLNRTEDSILRKGWRLGLDITKDYDQCLKKAWTKEEDELLRENYNLMSVKELMHMLKHRSRDAIIKRAKKLNLNSENRLWTQREEDYLKENWGIVQIETIAKKLRRTREAVLLKAYKLKLKEQATANGLFLTPKDISDILGVGNKTVYNWIYKGYIKSKRFKIHKVKKHQISVENFLVFLEEHSDKWNTTNSDLSRVKSFFPIHYNLENDELVTKIPKWLKLKIETEENAVLRHRPWTVKEEITLMQMINSGVNYEQIAADFRRTYESVKSKAYCKRREQRKNTRTFEIINIDDINQKIGDVLLAEA